MLAAEWLETLRVVIWPAVVLAAIAFLVLTKRGRDFFQRTIHKVTAFGVEVSLDQSTATEVKKGADALFQEYRRIITDDLDKENRLHGLQARVALIARDYIVPYLDKAGFNEQGRDDVRCTVYIPDVLFESALCQLTDYVGLDGGRKGGGKGRAFTTRFGIIGLVWRLQAERVEAQVDPDPDKLVAHWGMTIHEAQSAGVGRQAFSAVTLTFRESIVGLFYADAYRPATFGWRHTQANLAEVVRRGAIRTGLTVQLNKLNEKFERRGPRLKPFDR